MVRLKPNINALNEFLELRSQFHYGSIKTISKAILLESELNPSQFHYGSIKTLTKTKKERSKTMEVSIPLWFD